MSKYSVVKMDISSKQEYIYASNRLKEIVGASKIIEFTSEILGRIIVEEMKDEYSVNDLSITKSRNIDGCIHIEGGGNLIYFFKDQDTAEEFIKRFSTYVLKHFEGLKVNFANVEFNITQDLAIDLYNKLDKQILQKKNQINKLNYLSFGIYDKCDNTGKAKGYEVLEISDDNPDDEVSKLVSKESYHKRKFYEEMIFNPYNDNENGNINKAYDDFYRVKKYLKEDANNKIKNKIEWMRSYFVNSDSFSLDEIISINKFDHKHNLTDDDKNNLKESKIKKRIINLKDVADNNNYIGLSFLDGNGMGSAFRGLPLKFIDILKNEVDQKKKNEIDQDFYESLKKYKPFKNSEKLSKNIKTTIEENNYYFLSTIEVISNELKKGFETELIKLMKDYKIVPIIIGGDDIAFWTSGKDSIEVSKEYIKNLAQNVSLKENITNQIRKYKIVEPRFKNSHFNILNKFSKISVSGGVAITSYNYPITKSSKLVDELETNAKNVTKKNRRKGITFPCYIDWELVRGEQKSKLKELRFNKETNRPYKILEFKRNNELNFENDIDDLSKSINRIINLKGEKDSEGKNKYIEFFQETIKNKKISNYYIKKYQFGNTNKNFKKEIILDAIELVGLFDNN
ncbi:MAG: Cas10/Cmr2 second palm domain-containing protein [Bacillota bacterium]